MPETPWWHNPPQAPDEVLLKLEARFHMLRSQGEEGQALRKLLQSLTNTYQTSLREARESCPIAFFKPSYEQALALNSWIHGVNFPITFASNRIGKTTGYVINALLWILPNDPAWIMFQPYTDHLHRRVQVIPRPPLRAILPLQAFFREFPLLAGDPHESQFHPQNHSSYVTSQREAPGFFRPSWPAAPIQEGSTIWLGAPDKEWHRAIMMRRWKDWLPPHAIAKWNTTDCYFQLDTRSDLNPKPTIIDVSCKSYESKDEKWSGDAVTGIMLSEGFSEDILSEIKNRVAPHAFASWDYTPVEARNVGKKVQLAYRVFKGQEPLPLVHTVFSRFRVADAPDHIIPPDKKADMIRMWQNKDAGKARIEGEFFSSSRALLSKLNKEHHCISLTFQELQDRFPTLKLFRSIDPGFDHPTACCWAALAPNNVWYIYRFLSERGLTIGERCRKIIELSHNQRERIAYGSGPNEFYWQEVHPNPDSEAYVATIADYHLFITDQTTGRGYQNVYAMEGLPLVESVHLGPETRVMDLDRKLDPLSYPFNAHPVRRKPPGSGVYFLIGEPGVAEAVEKMESLFWDMLQGGPNKGESKDKVPIHGDDELDALCQLTSSPFQYDASLPSTRRAPKDSEPEPTQVAYARHFNSAVHHQDYENVTSQQAAAVRLLAGVPGYLTPTTPPTHPTQPTPQPAGHF